MLTPTFTYILSFMNPPQLILPFPAGCNTLSTFREPQKCFWTKISSENVLLWIFSVRTSKYVDKRIIVAGRSFWPFYAQLFSRRLTTWGHLCSTVTVYTDIFQIHQLDTSDTGSWSCWKSFGHMQRWLEKHICFWCIACSKWSIPKNPSGYTQKTWNNLLKIETKVLIIRKFVLQIFNIFLFWEIFKIYLIPTILWKFRQIRRYLHSPRVYFTNRVLFCWDR